MVRVSVEGSLHQLWVSIYACTHMYVYRHTHAHIYTYTQAHHTRMHKYGNDIPSPTLSAKPLPLIKLPLKNGFLKINKFEEYAILSGPRLMFPGHISPFRETSAFFTLRKLCLQRLVCSLCFGFSSPYPCLCLAHSSSS